MVFLHQIKRTNNVYDKGIVVKENKNAALQSLHAYLGAYAYGNNTDVDYVFVMITDDCGSIIYPPYVWKADDSTAE